MKGSARFAASALAAVVLLATSAGLLSHDHGAAAVGDGYACAADHHAEPGTASTDPAAGLRASAKPHHHVCIAGHVNGPRPLPASYRAAGASWAPAIDSPAGITAPLPARGLATGRTSRGPPLA